MSTKTLLLFIISLLTQESIQKSIEKYLLENQQKNGSISGYQSRTQSISPYVISRARRETTYGPVIHGMRVEGHSSHVFIGDDMETYIKAKTDLKLRLFGDYLNSNDLRIGFATEFGYKDSYCNPIIADISVNSIESHTGVAVINLPEGKYYLCISREEIFENKVLIQLYKYVSDDYWMTLTSEGPFFPIWVQIFLIAVLLLMSGLFSGLNLGLMALDKNELQVIKSCGTEQEKRYARSITPVRKRGNYLLCTLLLGNVLVNSTLTIFLDDLSSGLIAVISSTLSIVVIGEIIPQALCSRHGLAVGAHTVWLTYIFMVVTFPLSFPISKFLDKVLGEEIGNIYDRERLMEYIRVTKDYNRLEADEVNIISGVLKLKKIKVTDIMTPIDDVFMLPNNAIMNFETLTDITSSGYSRIPIYENERSNVVAILHAKDLAFIDPDDSMHLKALIEFYKHPLYFVYEDVTLDVMLNEFKQGKSHMAFVRRITDNGINDPVFELTGVVTLEDVIEELIQAEINDETDVISDNRRKQKRKEVSARPNFSDFVRLSGEDESHRLITSQLALAAFRYLSTFVDPFTPQYISDNVLKRLMDKQIYIDIKVPFDSNQSQTENASDFLKERVLYSYGIPADYFILILEGKTKVIIGKENQQYEGRPFAYFGVSALGGQTFIPDFTVICLENTTIMKVTRRMYLAAIRATVMERQRDSNQSEDDSFHFDIDSNSDNQSLISRKSTVNNMSKRCRSCIELHLNSSILRLESGGGSINYSSESSLRHNVSTEIIFYFKYLSVEFIQT